MVDSSTGLTSQSDLFKQLDEAEDAMQNLRFQKSMQQLEDLSQLKKMKKKIARIKTSIQKQNKSIESDD